MPEKKGIDVRQYGLFATPLEEMIPSDAEVRVIGAFVDQLDPAGLGFVRAKSTGRDRYASDLLLKIYLYGYLNGVRSSRKLEKACRVNIELMWLTGRLTPGYHTIADFRKDHPEALKRVFREFTLLLKEWELLGLETLAVDGSKIRAQNSMKRNFNKKKIERHLDRIEKRIETVMSEWEAADEKDKGTQGPVVEELLAKLDERRSGYERIEQLIENSEDTQVSLTDPDARALPLHRDIVEVGYNVQHVVDDMHCLIVGQEVTNESDINALSDLVVNGRDQLGLGHEDQLTVLADKGYHKGAELHHCQENNIDTLVAERRSFNKNKPAGFRKEDFEYDAGEDHYICPAGQVLKTDGKWYDKPGGGDNAKRAYRFQRYKTARGTCGACPLRDRCLSDSARRQRRARHIERSEYAGALERNKAALNERPLLYKRRQAIVEHPFGTIKRSWGYTYTLLKSKEKVGGEWSLIATCYNIRRSMSILGIPELIKRLKAAKTTRDHLKSLILVLWELQSARVKSSITPTPWWLRPFRPPSINFVAA